MSKLSRHKMILELLDDGPVASQEELQRLLHKRGFDAGQATLSRDIRELGLAKTADGYSHPGGEAAGETDLPPVSRMVREFVTSVRAAQNLLVTNTSIGSAQPVAAALDAEQWPEMLGTLAGDDTILVVTSSNKQCRALGKKVRELMQ